MCPKHLGRSLCEEFPLPEMETFVKLALEKIVKASTKKDEELRDTAKQVVGEPNRQGFADFTLCQQRPSFRRCDRVQGCRRR